MYGKDVIGKYYSYEPIIHDYVNDVLYHYKNANSSIGRKAGDPIDHSRVAWAYR